MATESETGGIDPHLRAISVTSIAALAGIFAAVVSSTLTAGMDPSAAARDSTAQAVVLFAIIGQLGLLKLLGLYKEDFGPKDFLFVSLMTFSMWFVTWAILLTTGATF
jgi:hypothetical protein